jgi:hypothetical protein
MFMRNPSNHRVYQRQFFKSLLASAVSLILLFSMLPAALAAGGQAQTNDKALPVFDINKTDYDFGEIFLGETVTAAFTVRNLGAAPLQLAENPIVPGKPTVGIYRQPLRRSPSVSLRDLLMPAALTLGATPYT